MAEANPTPAAQQPGASDAATQKPAQTQDDIQKIRDGIFKEAREAYEPKLEKSKAEIAALKEQFKAERDWRMGVLENRAKLAGVTETLAGIARKDGPESFEKVIAEFEGFKPKQQAEAPKPVPQPGGTVGGDAAAKLNVALFDPSKNPGGIAAAAKAYNDACKQHGKSVVDKAMQEASR